MSWPIGLLEIKFEELQNLTCAIWSEESSCVISSKIPIYVLCNPYAEQPLQGLELQEKTTRQRWKAYRKAYCKEPKDNWCLLPLDLKPLI